MSEVTSRPRRSTRTILTASFVKSAPPGRYGDGRGGYGLILVVRQMANGRMSRTWAQRIRIGRRPTHLGIGRYPVVSLAEARAGAMANARTIKQGRDPRQAGVPTFAQAAEKVIALHEPTWKDGARSAAIWRQSLRDHAFPVLAGRRVSNIDTAAVLAVLSPIWNEKPVTARRVRQRIGAVMKWSVAQGYRQDNPAGDAIGKALPRGSNGVKHRAALPHGEVGEAVDTIRASGAAAATKLAFEFLVLTACRSGEVRLARWNEIDLDAAVWMIPAERMKTARPHRVPLAGRAVELLREAAEVADGSGLVFPSPRGKALSDMAISKLVKEQGIAAVPHGFRSSFRDWCGETGQPRELAEMALAHAIRGVEAAYARARRN